MTWSSSSGYESSAASPVMEVEAAGAGAGAGASPSSMAILVSVCAVATTGSVWSPMYPMSTYCTLLGLEPRSRHLPSYYYMYMYLPCSTDVAATSESARCSGGRCAAVSDGETEAMLLLTIVVKK